MEHIHGHAVFTPDRCLEVDGQLYSADHYLIASGGRPIIPSVVPGNSSCYESCLFIISQARATQKWKYSVSRKECNESLKICFLKAIMTTSKFIAHADEVTSQL